MLESHQRTSIAFSNPSTRRTGVKSRVLSARTVASSQDSQDHSESQRSGGLGLGLGLSISREACVILRDWWAETAENGNFLIREVFFSGKPHGPFPVSARARFRGRRWVED